MPINKVFIGSELFALFLTILVLVESFHVLEYANALDKLPIKTNFVKDDRTNIYSNSLAELNDNDEINQRIEEFFLKYNYREGDIFTSNQEMKDALNKYYHLHLSVIIIIFLFILCSLSPFIILCCAYCHAQKNNINDLKKILVDEKVHIEEPETSTSSDAECEIMVQRITGVGFFILFFVLLLVAGRYFNDFMYEFRTFLTTQIGYSYNRNVREAMENYYKAAFDLSSSTVGYFPIIGIFLTKLGFSLCPNCSINC